MAIGRRFLAALAVPILLAGCGGGGDKDTAKTAFCTDFNRPSPNDTPVEILQGIIDRGKAAAKEAPDDVAAAITVFVQLGQKAIKESNGKLVTKAAMGELGKATPGLDAANQKVIDYCAKTS